jgi:signal peptide peptidase SppA
MDESTSTIVLRKQIRDVKNDPRFVGAILCMDSPGGSVAGTSDLGDDIAALAAVKPVIGHVQDLCASACYWAASQCNEIYANNGTALVGSIGTIIATYDYSKMCEKEGIAAKVYATGDLKGAGFPGTEITPEQDQYFQGIVDATQRHFAEAVAKGRNLSIESVNKLATGAVFLAGQAQDASLIDGIKSFDQCLDRMGELLAQRQVTTSPGTPVGAAQETRMNSESKPATDAGTGGAAPEIAANNTVDPRAEVKRYVDAFGTSGAAWYIEGKTFEEASALHNKSVTEAFEEVKRENVSLKAEVAQLKSRVHELRGDAAPVSANLDPDTTRKATSNPSALENRIGPNLARVARSIQLPTTTNN